MKSSSSETYQVDISLSQLFTAFIATRFISVSSQLQVLPLSIPVLSGTGATLHVGQHPSSPLERHDPYCLID